MQTFRTIEAMIKKRKWFAGILTLSNGDVDACLVCVYLQSFGDIMVLASPPPRPCLPPPRPCLPPRPPLPRPPLPPVDPDDVNTLTQTIFNPSLSHFI